jgi:hypothetical protein
MPSNVGTYLGNNDEVCAALVELLRADETIGLIEVHYGDKNRIGQTPTVTVEPGPTDFVIKGTSYWQDVTFTNYVMVYLTRLNLDEDTSKQEGDTVARQVIDLLHTNKKLLNDSDEPRVIHGQVVRVEPGTAERGGQRLRAVRLTWRATSRATI